MEEVSREFQPSEPGYPGTLVTVSGPPGCGKTTVMERVIEVLSPECDIRLFEGKSVTTRVPRPDDRLDEYLHVSDDEFREMEERREFIWTVPNSGYLFGTLRTAVDEALRVRRISILNLVPGVVEKLHRYAGPANVISFYVQSGGSESLRRRMTKRGSETPKRIEERLKEAAHWSPKIFYGFIVLANPNEEPQGMTAAREVARIVRSRNLV